MLLLKKKIEEKPQQDQDKFGHASKYISDELELIQDQQENIVRVAEELEKAFAEVDKIKELIKVVKEIDKIITEKQIGEKRKHESKMINLMEDVKGLLKQQRYEDIERMMLQVQQESQLKLKLSQAEMQSLRTVMDKLVGLYQQSAGLCRLYTVIYDQVKAIYNQCAQELGIETTEEEELSRAGAYTERIH